MGRQAKQLCKGTCGGSRRPCRAAPGADGYCFMHSPDRAADRAAARSAGGQARHTPHSTAAKPPAQIRTLADVLALLDYAVAEAVVMENGVQRGKLLVQLATAYTEAIKVGEIEQRLGLVEVALKVGGSQ